MDLRTAEPLQLRRLIRTCTAAIEQNRQRIAMGDGDPQWLALRIERDHYWRAQAKVQLRRYLRQRGMD